jgi:hypothetical protein
MDKIIKLNMFLKPWILVMLSYHLPTHYLITCTFLWPIVTYIYYLPQTIFLKIITKMISNISWAKPFIGLLIKWSITQRIKMTNQMVPCFISQNDHLVTINIPKSICTKWQDGLLMDIQLVSFKTKLFDQN